MLTFFFLMIIIGTTSKGAATGFAGIPIGLALTLIHLISIPVTNTSVNPARSTGQALFAGGEYIGQLWLFWLAPILGALIAGFLGRVAVRALLHRGDDRHRREAGRLAKRPAQEGRAGRAKAPGGGDRLGEADRAARQATAHGRPSSMRNGGASRGRPSSACVIASA